jgi:hypothetical protein
VRGAGGGDRFAGSGGELVAASCSFSGERGGQHPGVPLGSAGDPRAGAAVEEVVVRDVALAASRARGAYGLDGGILGLFRALRPAGGSTLLTRAGEAAAVLTASVLAMLQAVDGVALKHAVDSLVAAPAALHDAAFHDAEIVRWMEWAMAGYYRIAFGLTAVLIGVAVARARALPRWTAAPALLSGVAFVADGVTVSYHGFLGTNLANLISLASFVLFAVAVTVAAWRPVVGRSGGTGTAVDTP